MNISDTTSKKDNPESPENLIVFSHLRWDFVYQRPQHLLTRFAQNFKVYFIEEPVFDALKDTYYSFSEKSKNIRVMVPHIPKGLSHQDVIQAQRSLLDAFLKDKQKTGFAFWYYTPMALEFSRHYTPDLIIYDCMDELSAFKFAPESIKVLERELLNKADVVFTGGRSLYEAKKNQHVNIHPFPSSIEKEHFLKAREHDTCPNDQISTANPKFGFYGVIDERFDIDLIRGIADARPDWEIILIGPVVKIDPATLPKNSNIHYLGPKNYQELPFYMATWSMALIPFLLNESTKYISPTKTPEYLAAGLPVISTPITDVVNPYGDNKLVHIAADAEGFIKAIEQELNTCTETKEIWLKKVDAFLDKNSWNITHKKMLTQMKKVMSEKLSTPIIQQYV